MKASIIIPTYNRIEILKKCLEALKKQTFRDFEIIIIDDGSIDNTKSVIKSEKALKLKYIHQEHLQQGVARNKGIKIAKGEFIIFIGDDIIPTENWLEKIISTAGTNRDCAVLGLTLWPSEIKPNRFMNYLAPNGPQFNYGKIKDCKCCGWDYFWTSNICVPKSFLESDKFDENFRGWGYEDLELGYRLEKRGLKIIFEKEAIAYHYHSYENTDNFFNNQKNAAKAAIYFCSKHPELKECLIEANKLKNWHKVLLIFFRLLPFLKKINGPDIIFWKLKRRESFEIGLK